MPETWLVRLTTIEAMAALAFARLAIAVIPMRAWTGHLGKCAGAPSGDRMEALRLAARVNRAALRLPFAVKCLPRAMALSLMLGRRGIAHRMVIAARPAGQRQGTDALHAWVEVEQQVVLGELPGPWITVLSLP
ncbi:lasso peptide biosynthesis B2 protein [Novosphingobium sp. NPDC080210]|uniref:lasso peptide biosynthesis B2 protein n=1 Tax=Novosphingobium sp. NPDC080210 TaxID=3390596 RepID=UPI003D05B0DA